MIKMHRLLWTVWIACTVQAQLLVSDAPSDVPSNFPSDAPSDVPSMAPTDTPSMHPTLHPTSEPSIRPSSRPSISPSLTPSSSPSLYPSAVPSVVPSKSPSLQPSIEPSKQPSASPSVEPSSTPTLSCRDLPSYKSPINGLGCEAHAGTDCIQWRFLGLDVDQLEDLVNSCPITCNIDCGTLQRFAFKLSYRLNGVSTFLGASSTQELSKVSIEFLTKYVHEREPESSFFLNEVELTSQEIIDSSTGTRLLRRTQEVSSDLLLTVSHRGLSIDFGTARLRDLLMEGILSPAFTRALRQSEDSFFTSASTAPTTESNPTDGDSAGGNDGPSSGGKTGAVLVCFFVVSGAGLGYFMKKRQVVSKASARSEIIPEPNDFEEGIEDISPIRSSKSHESFTGAISGAIKRALGVSPRNEGQAHENTVNTAPSESDNTTVPAGNGSHEEGQEVVSSESTWEEEAHPFVDLIPPMIVYDHIDGNEEESTKEEKKSSGVKPLMERRKASEDFIRSLNSYDQTAPFPFPEVYDTSLYSVRVEGVSSESSYIDEQVDKAGEIQKMVASETETKLPIKKAFSDDTHTSTSPRKSAVDTIPVIRRRNSEGNLPETAEGACLFSSSRSSQSCDNIDVVASSSESTGKLSPSTRRSMFRSMNFMPSPRRRFRSASPAKSFEGIPPRPERLTKRDDSFGSIYLESSENGSSFHVFKAPRIGTLGLVITDLADEEGTFIEQVKDYSPLLGQVMVNDRIISINSTDVSKMKAIELQKLFASGSSLRKVPMVKIAVKRENDREHEPSDTSSLGSKQWSWGETVDFDAN